MKRFLQSPKVHLSVITACIIAAMVFIWSQGMAKAEESSEVPEKRISITTEIATKYLDDNGAVYTNRPVNQNTVYVSLPWGFGAEFWNSKKIRGMSEGDEIDWSVYWGTTLPATVELEFGVSYIDLRSFMDNKGEDLWRFTGQIKKSFEPFDGHKLSPFLKGAVYLPVSSKEEESDLRGFHIQFGVEHALDIWKGWDLSHKASILYDDGAFGYERAGIFRWDAEAGYKLAGNITPFVSMKISTPLNHVNDGRREEFVPSIGIKFEF